MFRPQFANNEIYHICNHSIAEQNLFKEKGDYLRMVHDLFEFNDIAPALYYRYKAPALKAYQMSEVGPQTVEFLTIKKQEPRKMLVKILCWCLMPNHFHLLLQQLTNNGISLFMKKLGTGYAMYLNKKYERRGVLFEGRFKAVLVKAERHFIHLPFYIHCNPLDLIEPGWRQGKINNYQKAINFLENYRWSSHPDYLGKKNFPSISQREFLLDIFSGKENYKKQIEDWLKAMSSEEHQELSSIILDD